MTPVSTWAVILAALVLLVMVSVGLVVFIFTIWQLVAGWIGGTP